MNIVQNLLEVEKPIDESNKYSEEAKLLLGTRRPYSEYETQQDLEDDMEYFQMPPMGGDPTSKPLSNILILAGSGGGKTLLCKTIWSQLEKMGYKTCYFCPKGQYEAMRAKKSWRNDRMIPRMEPTALKLSSWMPTFNIENMNRTLVHNFKLYSQNLREFDERETWLGLGLTEQGANLLSRKIKKRKKWSVSQLRREISLMGGGKGSGEEVHISTEASIQRAISNIEGTNMVHPNFPYLDLHKEWEKVNSVVINYSGKHREFMSFDIGLKIRKAKEHNEKIQDKIPIFFFLDDSGFYAKYLKGQRYNFAVDEIYNLGFNYRSLDLSDVLVAQSLGIIDENVADCYPIKIISPFFEGIEGLRGIGVPQEAVDLLRAPKNSPEGLVLDQENHLVEWIMVDANKNVKTFYPFLPPCNHFNSVIEQGKYFQFENEEDDL